MGVVAKTSRRLSSRSKMSTTMATIGRRSSSNTLVRLRKDPTLLLVLLLMASRAIPGAAWEAGEGEGAGGEAIEPSEDVPVHTFELTVVTVGKASGREKRVQKPGFFLRGDDAAAAATRFVYLHALPLEHVPHFKMQFQEEWDERVPVDVKPRQKRAGRSKPMGPRAYLERGKEHVKAGRHGEAHFDFARAIVGEGMDLEGVHPAQRLTPDEAESTRELLREHHRKHSRALLAAEKTREVKAAAHEREVKVLEERRNAQLSAAADEAAFLDACAKAGWTGQGPDKAGPDDASTPPLHSLVLSLRRPTAREEEATEVEARIEAGQDAALAAVRFCAANRLTRPDDVLRLGLDLQSSAEAAAVEVPIVDDDKCADVEGCVTAAAEAMDGGSDDGGVAAARLIRAWIRGAAKMPETAAVVRSIKERLGVAMRVHASYRAMYAAQEDEDWEGVVRHAGDAERAASEAKWKPDALRKLALARAHFKLGQYAAAERNADRAIAAGRTSGDWRRGQTRALAVSLGAASAIRRGDADAALRVIAVAMRADPETPLFKRTYKGIKAAHKLMADADMKLDRGESRLAMDVAEDAAAALRGIGGREEDGGAMFAEVDARRCRAHAQMRAFEAALGACARAAAAVGCSELPSDASEADAKAAERKCAGADSRSYARVLMARAEVHLRDTYPEGALSDLRTAQERIQPTASRGSSEAGRLLRSIEEKLREAEEEKNKHDNNRDHNKMLDLPENLGELPKDRRCEFIKKAYKKAALKWHPDKAAEAGKMRAARKMNEMTEARDHVNERMGCTQPKRDPNEHHHHGHGGGHHDHFERMRRAHFQQQQQRRQRGRGGGGFSHWEF